MSKRLSSLTVLTPLDDQIPSTELHLFELTLAGLGYLVYTDFRLMRYDLFLVAPSESGWSECSKTCGGGEKFKMMNNVKQTLACNTLPCPGKHFTFVNVYVISRADFFRPMTTPGF